VEFEDRNMTIPFLEWQGGCPWKFVANKNWKQQRDLSYTKLFMIDTSMFNNVFCNYWLEILFDFLVKCLFSMMRFLRFSNLICTIHVGIK
jgi:hypothetical protein